MADRVVELRRGKPGHREPRVGLKAPPGAPTPPAWLDREARAEWRRVAPRLDELGVLAVVDRGVLSAYCDAWSKFTAASALLREGGLVHEPRSDRGVVKNPAWQIWREAGAALGTLARELGLSPAGRARMNVAPRPADDELDPDGILDR